MPNYSSPKPILTLTSRLGGQLIFWLQLRIDLKLQYLRDHDSHKIFRYSLQDNETTGELRE